jgi:hypothetical protein
VAWFDVNHSVIACTKNPPVGSRGEVGKGDEKSFIEVGARGQTFRLGHHGEPGK